MSNFQVIINLAWGTLLDLAWGTALAPCIFPFGHANKMCLKILGPMCYTKILSNFIQLRLRLIGEIELIIYTAFKKSLLIKSNNLSFQSK